MSDFVDGAYYWVLLTDGKNDAWAIAVYAGQYPGWFLTSSSYLHKTSDFKKIGHKVFNPYELYHETKH